MAGLPNPGAGQGRGERGVARVVPLGDRAPEVTGRSGAPDLRAANLPALPRPDCARTEKVASVVDRAAGPANRSLSPAECLKTVAASEKVWAGVGQVVYGAAVSPISTAVLGLTTFWGVRNEFQAKLNPPESSADTGGGAVKEVSLLRALLQSPGITRAALSLSFLGSAGEALFRGHPSSAAVFVLGSVGCAAAARVENLKWNFWDTVRLTGDRFTQGCTWLMQTVSGVLPGPLRRLLANPGFAFTLGTTVVGFENISASALANPSVAVAAGVGLLLGVAGVSQAVASACGAREAGERGAAKSMIIAAAQNLSLGLCNLFTGHIGTAVAVTFWSVSNLLIARNIALSAKTRITAEQTKKSQPA